MAGILLPLTHALQTVGMDLVEAFLMIKDTRSLLESFRSSDKFATLFSEAKSLADNLDVVLKQPRIPFRSVHRGIPI